MGRQVLLLPQNNLLSFFPKAGSGCLVTVSIPCTRLSTGKMEPELGAVMGTILLSAMKIHIYPQKVH